MTDIDPELPTVIGNPVSPYVRKVLAACAVKGIAVQIDPVTPFYTDDAFRQLSPLRRIPVWIDGEVVLNDSTVISEYLDETRDGPALFPSDPLARAHARWLEEYADSRLGDLLVWKLFFRLGLQPRVFKVEVDREELAKTQSELPETFDYLESQLPQTGFLFGDQPMAADFAIAAPFVNAEIVGVTPDATRWPVLTGWLQRMEGTVLGPLNGAARSLVRTRVAEQRSRLVELGLTPASRDHSTPTPSRGPMTPS